MYGPCAPLADGAKRYHCARGLPGRLKRQCANGEGRQRTWWRVLWPPERTRSSVDCPALSGTVEVNVPDRDAAPSTPTVSPAEASTEIRSGLPLPHRLSYAEHLRLNRGFRPRLAGMVT